MNPGGDAAEQVIRISLEGVEVAAKLTGNVTKELVVFLYTILSQREKTRGKIRLESLLKSGKPLHVFTVQNKDAKKFAVAAKRYGILFYPMRVRRKDRDDMCDILIRAEDLSRVNRIVERFHIATLDIDKIKEDILSGQSEELSPEEQEQMRAEEDSLLDDLLGAEPAQDNVENAGGEKDLIDDLFGDTPDSAPEKNDFPPAVSKTDSGDKKKKPEGKRDPFVTRRENSSPFRTISTPAIGYGEIFDVEYREIDTPEAEKAAHESFPALPGRDRPAFCLPEQAEQAPDGEKRIDVLDFFRQDHAARNLAAAQEMERQRNMNRAAQSHNKKRRKKGKAR